MYWKALLDNGSSEQWEQELTLPDGTVKLASVDDLDRSQVNQLLVCDSDTDDVLYSLAIPQELRPTHKFIHRRNVGTSYDGGQIERYHFAGFNIKDENGTHVELTRIYPDGILEPAHDEDFTLHAPERF